MKARIYNGLKKKKEASVQCGTTNATPESAGYAPDCSEGDGR